MHIYLMRHGESNPGSADDERSLSEQGRKDIQLLAEFLAALNISVTSIFHSKKLRTLQTATIIASAISSSEPLQLWTELEPMNSITPVFEKINKQNFDMLLVGHMPFMGKLVAKLITGSEDRDVISFNPGTILCLEKVREVIWTINWILSPELFRRGIKA